MQYKQNAKKKSNWICIKIARREFMARHEKVNSTGVQSVDCGIFTSDVVACAAALRLHKSSKSQAARRDTRCTCVIWDILGATVIKPHCADTLLFNSGKSGVKSPVYLSPFVSFSSVFSLSLSLPTLPRRCAVTYIRARHTGTIARALITGSEAVTSVTDVLAPKCEGTHYQSFSPRTTQQAATGRRRT